jgi:hypothetical protein
MAKLIQFTGSIGNSISGITVQSYSEPPLIVGFIELPVMPNQKLKKKCCKKYQRKGRHCKSCPKIHKKK